jgi:hypothetical protein
VLHDPPKSLLLSAFSAFLPKIPTGHEHWKIGAQNLTFFGGFLLAGFMTLTEESL